MGSVHYTSKIIKAGALLADTKMLLLHWDLAASVPENLQRIRQENVFGKASRSRVEDIVAIFRQRYMTEKSVTEALVALVKKQFPAAALDRILYFHTVKADRLLHDVVTKILVPMKAQGLIDINALEIQKTLSRWVKDGKTTTAWSESTICRVTQGCSRHCVTLACSKGLSTSGSPPTRHGEPKARSRSPR